MITEDLKEKNLDLFLKYLKRYNVDISLISDDIKSKIKNATFSNINENRTAYDGSLLNIIFNILTPTALKINDVLDETLRVDKNSLIKVCLLSHISKCEMFEPNDNEWEKEKRGILYKYTKSNVALKMGMRSIILSQQLGVQFTPEEIEAMIVLDRMNDDEQAKFFSNPLSVILKQANELTFLQIRLKK